jgi:hypothetical protein
MARDGYVYTITRARRPCHPFSCCCGSVRPRACRCPDPAAHGAASTEPPPGPWPGRGVRARPCRPLVADRTVTGALGWRGGDRLALTAEAGVVVSAATRPAWSPFRPGSWVPIPAALRHRCGGRSEQRVHRIVATATAARSSRCACSGQGGLDVGPAVRLGGKQADNQREAHIVTSSGLVKEVLVGRDDEVEALQRVGDDGPRV